MYSESQKNKLLLTLSDSRFHVSKSAIAPMICPRNINTQLHVKKSILCDIT